MSATRQFYSKKNAMMVVKKDLTSEQELNVVSFKHNGTDKTS